MITINVDKAKVIGHKIRREMRTAEFDPLDQIIAKQIPGNNIQEIEAQRQQIRDKYSEIQTQIESAQTAQDIKDALGI